MSKETRRAAGTGSIYKKTVNRNGKEYRFWEAQVTIGVDPGTGKQLRKTFTGKTQAEVREKMQAAAVAVQDGSYFEPSKMTVGQWLDLWLKEYCSDKKYLTLSHYKSMCENHIKPALGAVKLSKLTPPQVQTFYNSLQRKPAAGKQNAGKRDPLSAKTIRNIHGILSKAMSVAVKQGMIRSNPAELATLPRVEKKEIRPLTDAQIAAFLKVSCGDEYERIYKLIIFTGLREAEAIGLTWDCVDFSTNTLLINKQLQRRANADGGYTFAALKNDKTRTVTASPFVMQLLKEQYRTQTEQRLRSGEAWIGWQTAKERETSLVFTKADGNHVNITCLYNHYKKLAGKIGMPESRVHDLRHTFAVLSLQNGDDVKTVQDNLGHATAAFTLDVYGHASTRMKEASAARMQAYIENLA